MSEKKKKPFYKKWWVWLIAIIVIGGIATAGGEESEKVGDSKPASSEEEKKEYGVNEKVKLGDHAVEVTKVEKSQGSDIETPKEGKEFVIVHVTIENNGKEEITYNPFDFKMKNSQGQIVDSGITTIDMDTSLSSGELSAGGNVSGTIAFEQPKDDEKLQLIFEPNFWSSKQIIFNLN